MTYLHQVSQETRSLRLPVPLHLESGDVLDDVTVAYRTWGRLNSTKDNAVLVCHALTGSADVDGWWSDLLGPGRALDPNRDFVVATNVLGGCYGTSGPSGPAGPSGKAPGPDFPSITIRDQVQAQAQALRALGVEGMDLVVGGSMGGMQALEWAAMEPLPVSAVSAIGTPARHHPWAMGLAETQRQAIRADPAWKGGRYENRNPPEAGLATARMVALCSYRSPGSFHLRFERDVHPEGGFQVGSYLRYQGQKLSSRFDANSYLVLTEAMDTHDLARGRGTLGEALAGLRPRIQILGIQSDVLYPPHEIQELAEGIPDGTVGWIDSPHGHDAFLIEQDQVDSAVRGFRKLPRRELTASVLVGDRERRAERCA
jgi:homoserine O-acetyltransferase